MTVERIIDEVARTYGMTPEDITKQKSKKANVSNARHIAIYITRELTNLTVKEIGNLFGGRHYTTVLYSISKVEEQLERDVKIRELVDDMMKNIKDR